MLTNNKYKNLRLSTKIIVKKASSINKNHASLKENPLLKMVSFHAIDYPTPVNLSY
jgi:hypothetical protein